MHITNSTSITDFPFFLLFFFLHGHLFYILFCLAGSFFLAFEKEPAIGSKRKAVILLGGIYYVVLQVCKQFAAANSLFICFA